MTGDSSELSALFERIAAEVSGREPPGGMHTRIVGVDGGGGAGKSSLAQHLARALGGCQIVHTDDFAAWANPIDWWPTLIERVLEPVSQGEVVRFMPTQWSPELRPDPVEFAPAEFLVLEGVTACREGFRPYLTYAIWIETSAEVRLRRGLERDGQAALPDWERWMAEEDAYRERERPDLSANLVLDGERDRWT